MIFIYFSLFEAQKPRSNLNTLTKVVIDAGSDKVMAKCCVCGLFIIVALVTTRQHSFYWYCYLIIFTLKAISFPVFPLQRPWRFLPSGASQAEAINVLNPKTHQSPGVSHSTPLAPAVSQTEQKNKRPKQCFRPFADNQMAFFQCFIFFENWQAERYLSSTSLHKFYRWMIGYGVFCLISVVEQKRFKILQRFPCIHGVGLNI